MMRISARPVFEEMPDLVKTKIVNNSDFDSRTALEHTCSKLQEISRKSPFYFSELTLIMLDDENMSIRAKISENDEMSRTRTSSMKVIFDYFRRLIQNPKTEIGTLKIFDRTFTTMPYTKFQSYMKSLDQLIHAEELYLRCYMEGDILKTVLEQLKPVVLRNIMTDNLFKMLYEKHLDDVAELEQWKCAKRFIANGMLLSWKLNIYKNFEYIDTELLHISSDDAWEMRKALVEDTATVSRHWRLCPFDHVGKAIRERLGFKNERPVEIRSGRYLMITRKGVDLFDEEFRRRYRQRPPSESEDNEEN